jgi:hypothetical protein
LSNKDAADNQPGSEQGPIDFGFIPIEHEMEFPIERCIEASAPGCGHLAGVGHDNMMATHFQKTHGDPLIDQAILHQQNVRVVSS